MFADYLPALCFPSLPWRSANVVPLLLRHIVIIATVVQALLLPSHPYYGQV
jgi:hypothetical protein